MSSEKQRPLISIIEKDYKSLMNIFCLSNQRALRQDCQDEIFLVDLFLKYLGLKLNRGDNEEFVKNIIQLDNQHIEIIRQIFNIFEQWQSELKQIQNINQQGERYFSTFIQDLQNKIQQSNLFVLPTGFNHLKIEKSDFQSTLMFKDQYKGFHPSCMIIKNSEEGFKEVSIIDPLTPYQPSISELNVDKINQGIIIDKVPNGQFTLTFLKQLILIRIKQPESRAYSFSDFYEILLPQLEGQSFYNAEKDGFYILDERKYQNLSFTLIKKVFLYFLKQYQLDVLYDHLIIEFQFELLINTHQLYFDEFSKYKFNEQKAIELEFLLNQMCDKIAFEAYQVQNIDKQLISRKISQVKQQIQLIKDQRDTSKIMSKHIVEITFTDSNFSNFISRDLKDLHFIQKELSNNCSAHIDIKENKEVININEFKLEENIQLRFNLFNSLLDKLTQEFQLNRIIQICLLIEDFVFSFSDLEFRGWCAEIEDPLQISNILLKTSKLYFNCFYYLFSNLFPDLDSNYDPNYYTKLVLTMFSLYALMQELVKIDEIINLEQNGFTGCTLLNDKVKLDYLLQELSNPNQKWFNLLLRVQSYYQKEQKSHKKYLFNFQNLNNNTTDLLNIETQFYVQLIQENYTSKAEILEKLLNSEQSWYQKNAQISLSSQFLPELLQNYRDISYLARICLFSFSNGEIYGNYYHKYNQMELSYNYYYNQIYIKMGQLKFTIYSDFSKERYTNYYLNRQGKNYQRIIESQKVRNKFLTENEMISTQDQKSVQQSRRQYYAQSFIQLNQNLKYIQLFCALQNHEISFEKEEECYLVKQIIHKGETIKENNDLLHNLSDQKLSIKLIGQLTQIGLNLNEKKSQCLSLFHLIDVLIFLFEYCSERAQILIQDAFQMIRNHIQTQLKSDVSKYQSIQSGLCILTYVIKSKLTKKEFEEILEFRVIIENCFRMNHQQPKFIYYRVMEYLLSINEFYVELNLKDITFLQNYIQVQNGEWVYIKQFNKYTINEYTYIPLQGSILKNGFPLTGLPNVIIQSNQYQECCGNLNILFEITTSQYKGNNLITYESQNYKSGKILITLLKSNNIWIQEKSIDELSYRTFISRQYFENFPFYLKNKINFDIQKRDQYYYWFKENKILITNSNRKIKFIVDLISDQIKDFKTKMFLVPFSKKFITSNLYDIIQQIEDKNYIFGYKQTENDKNVSSIHFLRLGLSFNYIKQQLHSNEFKDFCLAKQQSISTLEGVSQYLILEKINNQNNQKILLIPFHPILKTKIVTVNNINEFDLTQIFEPSYFTYNINEQLAILESETTAGLIFLSLLYFKSRDINCDKFTGMNSYENCSELLSNCQQNQEYNNTEFNLLLQFFESECSHQDNILEKCSQQKKDLQSIFKLKNHGLYPDNINQHAIYLKLILLMVESYRIDFIIKPSQFKKDIFLFLYEQFFNYHFKFYLIFKNRIYYRCQLSQKEEKKLIKYFKSYFSDSKLDQIISEYYKYIHNQRNISIVYQHLDYLTNHNKFNSQKKRIEVEMWLFQKYAFVSFKNENIKIKKTINYWKGQQFCLNQFSCLYKQIMNQSIDLNPEEFQYYLKYYHLQNIKNKIDDYNIFIYILQLAVQDINQFKTINIPDHFQREKNNYSLSNQSQVMEYNDIPNISGYYSSEQIYNTKQQIYQLLSNKYLNREQKCSKTVDQLERFYTIYDLRNYIGEILSNNNIQQVSYDEQVFSHLLKIKKNEEVSNFFTQLSQKCDLLTLNIKQINPTSNLTLKSLNLDKKEINKQLKTTLQIEIQNDPQNASKEINQLNIDQIYVEISQFFETKLKNQEHIQFPFDELTNQVSSLAINIFAQRYGEQFLKELKMSFTNQIQQTTNINQEKKQLGYLQTQIEECQFKSNCQIEDLQTFLQNISLIIQKHYQNLYQELFNSIYQLDESNISVQDLLLLRLCRKSFIPNKSDILSIIIDKNKFQQINPFLSTDNQEKQQNQIYLYLELFTFGQQIQRVLQQIINYEEAKITNNEDEKERLLQQIIQNIQKKRCYNIKEHPHWILFEFQNNILIREQQKELILSIFNDTENTIYQLNMGEGKTSVILILLGQMIADGKNIIRINCLESLFGVMQDILKKKYNGLLKKKVFILPFSRDIEFTNENINKLENILKEIRDEQHILLITPEQRLCLQLKKQECLLDHLSSKDANDIFDWELHNKIVYKQMNQKSKNFYQLNENQQKIKSVLENLGYINSNNNILTYPDNKNQFYDNVNAKYASSKQLYFKGFSKFVYTAYQVLRMQSLQLKDYLFQRIKQLNNIEKYTFVDILDESDEILRHGKELNYTLGQSEQLNGGNIRWEIPLLIFRLIFYDSEINDYFKQISGLQPCPILYNNDFKPRSQIGGGIHYLRLVDGQFFEEKIKPKIVEKITKILREKFDEPHSDIKDINNNINYGSYEDYISGKLIKNEKQIHDLILNIGKDMLYSFLLAKGWLSHNIFYHVMSYRYRVEYGLSAMRDKEIAIPFKGKDLPSEKSEFSHPDIMIGFTILSYLYNGLTFQQFKDAINKLNDDDREDKNAILQSWYDESQEWISEYASQNQVKKPVWLQSFKSFEIKDPNQLLTAYNCLCRNFKVVKFYLSNFTFPNNAKFYKKRITGNAHSLVSESQSKGFSGTDDKNDTMPESIIPKRMPSQFATNGKLIHILSRDINSVYEPKVVKNSQEFLNEVCGYVETHNNCYMLIDSGAIITEINNKDVAKYIISHLNERFKGVVYFSDINNKISVILRNQQVIPLSTCHYDKRQLFVYLDESHTRGSDFVLPLSARAILTLGRGMNKDKLVQAAMRLRDLEYKQSIVIWGTEEITSDIAKMNGISIKDITSKHVIIWASANTVLKNEKDLYPVMLLKFKNQIKNQAIDLQKQFLEQPYQSLISCCENIVQEGIQDLYTKSPQIKDTLEILTNKSNKYLSTFFEGMEKETSQNSIINQQMNNLKESQFQNFNKMIEKLKDKLPKQTKTYDTNFDCDEENEQEVEEIQQQEQVSLTKQANPQIETQWLFTAILSQDFINYCKKSTKDYPELIRVKNYFNSTSFSDLKSIKWNKNILATNNFMKTVSMDFSTNIQSSDYFRPINMILVHNFKKLKIILLSGFEANNIIQVLQKSKSENVYLIHIDDLSNPLTTPSNIKIQFDDKLQQLLMIIRLLNGDCYFRDEEKIIVQKCLGIIFHSSFHQKKEISDEIYNSLAQCKLIKNGQFSAELLKMVFQNIKNEQITTIEEKYNIDIYIILRKILEYSILDQSTQSMDLINLFSNLAAIRGKVNQYSRSTLRQILEINCEWNL